MNSADPADHDDFMNMPLSEFHKQPPPITPEDPMLKLIEVLCGIRSELHEIATALKIKYGQMDGGRGPG